MGVTQLNLLDIGNNEPTGWVMMMACLLSLGSCIPMPRGKQQIPSEIDSICMLATPEQWKLFIELMTATLAKLDGLGPNNLSFACEYAISLTK